MLECQAGGEGAQAGAGRGWWEIRQVRVSGGKVGRWWEREGGGNSDR